MKHFFRKSLLALGAVLCISALPAAEYKLRFEQEGYTVPELSENASAIIKVYATFGEDVQNYSIRFNFGNATGFSFDKTASSFNQEVVIGGTPTIGESGTDAITTITGNQGVVSISQTSAEVLVSTLKFNVSTDALASATQTISATVKRIMGTPGQDLTAAADSATSITIPIYSGFNFAVKQEACIQTTEKASFTLNNDNFATYFTCQIWDSTQGQVVDSTAVEFSDFSFAPTENAPAVELSAAKNGFTITPDSNGNGYGDYTLTFKVKPEGSSAAADEFTIPVKITPVNQAPSISFNGTFSGTEGTPLSFIVDFTDDASTFAEAVKEVTFNGQTLNGTWTNETFTATDAIDKSLVAHPAKSNTFELKVVVTDTGKATDTTKLTAEATQMVVVNDVDQELDVTAATLELTNTAPKVTESVTATAQGATDADSDTITYQYIWTKNSVQISTGTTLNLVGSGLVKGDEITVSAKAVTVPYNDATIDSKDIAQTASFTIANSVPSIAAATSIFIQKDQSTSGTMNLVYTDADGESDLKEYVITNNHTDKFTVAESSGVLTITMVDTINELYGTDNTFTVYAKDKDDATSNTVTVAVTYRKDPPPVLGTIDVAATVQEGIEFTATITAADSDTTVTPSGVAAITPAIRDENGNTLSTEFYTIIGSFTPTSGTNQATEVITIRLTNAYITHPNTNRNLQIAFTAMDGNGAVSEETSTTITVQDVDQLPAKPVSAPVFTQASYLYNDTLAITAATAGSDEDGDTTTVTYTWQYKKANEAAFTTVASNVTDLTMPAALTAAIQKDVTIRVLAFTCTTPYSGDAAYSQEYTEVSTVIGDTAPIMVTQSVEATCAERQTEDSTYGFSVNFEITDPDCSQGDKADRLTWKAELIGTNTDKGAFEQTFLSEDSTKVTFKFNPNLNVNTVDCGAMKARVTATDTAGQSAQLEFDITITEVNNAPVVEATDYDYYVSQLDNLPVIAVPITTMGDVYESTQSIQDTEIAVTSKFDSDPTNSIFSAKPTVAFENKQLVVTYQLKEDVLTMAVPEETITLSNIRDTGSTNGLPDFQCAENVTITIHVSSSPWYPIFEFTPAAHDACDGYRVVLSPADADKVEFILEGNRTTVYSTDYLTNGFGGFAVALGSSLEVPYEVFTYSKGSMDAVSVATSTLSIQGYTTPAKPAMADSIIVDNGQVTIPAINVPMAHDYTMAIVNNASGETVYSIHADFMQDTDSKLWTIVKQQIAEKTLVLPVGTYTFRVQGFNPNGASALLEESFTVQDAQAIALGDWAAYDGMNYTENHQVLAATNTTVKLFWPEVANATGYRVYVFDAVGEKLCDSGEIQALNYTVTLPSDGTNAKMYNWYVRAIRGDEQKSSQSFDIAVRASENLQELPVLTEARVGESAKEILLMSYGQLTVGQSFQVSYDYADLTAGKWCNGTATATVKDVDGTLYLSFNLTCDVNVSDYVFIQLGDDADWMPFEILNGLAE